MGETRGFWVRWVLVLLGCIAALVIATDIAKAQGGYTKVGETQVGPTSGNVSWHGVAVTDDGTLHHTWYRGLHTERFSPGLYGPEIINVTLAVRQDEPEIVAKGDKVFVACSDRSQTHSQQMMVLGYPWFADGTRPVMELIMSNLPDSNWLGRPFFHPSPNDDLVGVAFTGNWDEDALMSEYSFLPGMVRTDVLFSPPAGHRQTYASGAANSNGAYLVWRDMSLSGGGANGAVMGSLEAGPETLLGPGYAGEPRVVADHSTDLLGVVWHSNQQAWCRILDPLGVPISPVFQVNTSQVGFCRDVYAQWDSQGSLFVIWERVAMNQRSLEFVRVSSKGGWGPDGAEVAAFSGTSPYSIDQRDRGCHGLAFHGDMLYIPFNRWNGQNRDGWLATWKK